MFLVPGVGGGRVAQGWGGRGGVGGERGRVDRGGQKGPGVA